jgi:hypothetical protein
VLAIYFVPVFFVATVKLFGGKKAAPHERPLPQHGNGRVTDPT